MRVENVRVESIHLQYEILMQRFTKSEALRNSHNFNRNSAGKLMIFRCAGPTSFRQHALTPIHGVCLTIQCTAGVTLSFLLLNGQHYAEGHFNSNKDLDGWWTGFMRFIWTSKNTRTFNSPLKFPIFWFTTNCEFTESDKCKVLQLGFTSSLHNLKIILGIARQAPILANLNFNYFNFYKIGKSDKTILITNSLSFFPHQITHVRLWRHIRRNEPRVWCGRWGLFAICINVPRILVNVWRF
ncbi:hypothetical protein EGR_10545 [Echinococcus granulosus]|uniref:Uncharacterized protein n=1 Tax=Echinococcus granulosus TaxID=6210 RepID=W6U238_ECHGR|nr:hypothetical protein EGR_10545 [Echinococcus granulosus]EUB54591.1 hypothetical protein EGR_10545 [Echinococcus granulosus]